MTDHTDERTEALRLVRLHERLFHVHQDHVTALKLLLRLEAAATSMEDATAVRRIRTYLDRHYSLTEWT